MTFTFSTTDALPRKLLSATIAMMLVIGLVGSGALLVGSVAAEETDDEDDWDEILNSVIETTEETDHVEYDLVFADEFGDEVTEETVELTIYDEADWSDDEVEETAVLEETVTGSPDETVTHEYSVGTEDTDDLEAETEYRVIVDAENGDHIESGYVAPDDELVGGATFGDADTVPGFGIGVGVAAVAIAVAGLARVRGGGHE